MRPGVSTSRKESRTRRRRFGHDESTKTFSPPGFTIRSRKGGKFYPQRAISMAFESTQTYWCGENGWWSAAHPFGVRLQATRMTITGKGTNGKEHPRELPILLRATGAEAGAPPHKPTSNPRPQNRGLETPPPHGEGSAPRPRPRLLTTIETILISTLLHALGFSIAPPDQFGVL